MTEPRRPPKGWTYFGTHAGPKYCEYVGQLAFSEEKDDIGEFPLWERHDNCTAVEDE